MAELIQVTPSDRAVFIPEEFTRAVRSEVLLTNISETAVNFKIRTTAPNIYSIQPSKGLLSPSASTTILLIGNGIDTPRPSDRFQLTATASSASQTLVLGCRMLPSAEYMTMKSVAGTIYDSGGGRETMEERRLVREMRAECEEKERMVEDLKRKVRVLETGVLLHKVSAPMTPPSSGYSNVALLLAFLLGLASSLFVPTLSD